MNFGSVTSGGSFLDQIHKKQEDNLEKLASGKKVNKAADGAAAQQIIDRLTADSSAYQQSIRNGYDGVSLAQTADGALEGITQDTQRIRELALQSGSGIYSASDRDAIQSEISQLQQNIQSTIENTEFAGQSLFSGGGEFSFQMGSEAGQTQSIGTADFTQKYAELGISDIDVTNTSGGGIAGAIEALDGLSEFVSAQRGDLGAAQNAFESAINNLATTNENVQAARSRIQDTDYAQVASENAADSIRGQAATAVASQARQQESSVVSLLQ
ncbi:flagellin [Algibacillus agarilyticus]|uniref:flagellin n=1 Tax=Algibacillus agarilyticus TaxID=2234133 RepID=UPI000DD0DC0F|nr:flagellin [Algibacillus agarilyticus]